jgi:hypothetical protein
MIKNWRYFNEEYEYIPKPEDHIGKELSIDDVRKMNVPNDIIEMMQDWPIIWKSPYSDSMYNTKDLSWTYKPDGSLRVADHWNFFNRGKTHCKTDVKIPNNTHVSIGKYDRSKGLYHIIKTSPTPQHVQGLKNKIEIKKFMLTPEIIEAKKKFKKVLQMVIYQLNW